MKRSIHSLRTSSSFFLTCIFAIGIAGILTAAPQSAAAATFNVNSTLDLPDVVPGDGLCNTNVATCTLRAAVMEANASAGADTINVPAGTYTLTLGPFDDEFGFDGANEASGDLDILNDDLTILGAGAASTIIDGGAIDRIFDINSGYTFSPATTPGNVRIEGVTLRNGNSPTDSFGFFHSGGAIQYDGLDWNTFSLANTTLTVVNCTISDNVAAGQGGGIASFNGGSLVVTGTSFSGNDSTNSQGGGIFFDGASDAGTRTFTVSNGSFSANTAPNSTFGSGGAIWSGGSATFTVDNNSFASNVAGANGGGIFADAFLMSNTKAINKNKFTNNSAKQGGGVFNRNGALTFDFNLVVGNTASTDPTSTGLRQSAPGSISSIANDWWGCNQGPSTTPCDRASGPLGFGVTQWLVLSHTATPNSIATTQSTTLQADFFLNNLGSVISASDLGALNGRTVTFNNAVLGTISGADPTINAGKANATFTAGAIGGNGSADATVDSATVTASILIGEAAMVTTNPTDQTVCDGGTATFTASASGFPTPTVQWQVSSGGPFTDIPGATSTTLMFTATLADNGKQYRAVFTNSGGTATTTAATLTVTTTTTTDPPDQTVCKGATATFSTTASGIGPFHYAWTLDGNPFNGDSPTINVPTGSLSSGPHTIVVTTSGACGSAMQTAILTVGNPPVITLSTTTVSMWPPNHAYHTFNVSDFVSSASGCEGDLTNSVVIASVSSDEAEDNPLGADGNTLNDIVIAANCKSVQLRAERDANLNGRVYTITFKVTDSQGQTATATATVTVPVNQSGPAAVNGPGPGSSVNSLCP